MASSTIRIHDTTKQELLQRIKEFEVLHGMAPTMDQLIKQLLHKPPAQETAKTKPSKPKQARTSKSPKIIELHKQGMRTADIAKEVNCTPRHCRDVIKKHKDSLLI